ncbi:hypothetical protein ACRDNQ_05290 [Palleronia sp. KMU-117]|uniref:hypothetical protein n=1 Tax=Palleronia sp. KMU-117 TaxID=3434108 RepID=UPI003D706A0F
MGLDIGAGQTVRELVARLSDELVALSSLAARIERALPQGAAAPSASSARDLQELDRLRQTLDDLGRLTGALASALPADLPAPADLARSLRLRSVSERLFARRPPHDTAADEAGRLTLL